MAVEITSNTEDELCPWHDNPIEECEPCTELAEEIKSVAAIEPAAFELLDVEIDTGVLYTDKKSWEDDVERCVKPSQTWEPHMLFRASDISELLHNAIMHSETLGEVEEYMRKRIPAFNRKKS